MVLNINTDALVVYTNQLEKLHKSGLPIAIRSSLNDVAFEMKKFVMPRMASQTFEERKKNFFKANSRVEMAQGFDMKKMAATVGFVSSGLHNKSTNWAVKDLEQQESGGRIGGRAYIPMEGARVSGTGITKTKFAQENIRDKIINAKNVRSISGHGASKMLKAVKTQKIIRAAIIAKKLHGDNAYILGNPNAAGSQTLFKVESLNILKSRYTFPGGGKTQSINKLDIKLIPLFRVKKNRSVNVGGSHLMKKSAETSVRKMDDYFIKNAIKQIKRIQEKK